MWHDQAKHSGLISITHDLNLISNVYKCPKYWILAWQRRFLRIYFSQQERSSISTAFLGYSSDFCITMWQASNPPCALLFFLFCRAVVRFSNPSGLLVIEINLGSVAGPVIQANWRLIFEDDLRLGGLLCFTTQWTSVFTGLAEGMVTLKEPYDG